MAKRIERCKQQDITAIRLSKESHLIWKKYFHNIPLYFRIYGDFECNNSIAELQHIGNKTKNVFGQNPNCNGFYIVSALNNVLQSGYCSYFVEINVESFVNEVIKKREQDEILFQENIDGVFTNMITSSIRVKRDVDEQNPSSS